MPEPDTGEPFGQTGVRQYIGPILHWVCVVCFAVSLTMWYRSSTTGDILELRQRNQIISVLSVDGHLRIHASFFESRRYGASGGWGYDSAPVGRRRVRDTWNNSILERIGVQLSLSPLSPDAQAGFWLRVKWYFAAAASAVLPLWRCVLRWRRRKAAG